MSKQILTVPDLGGAEQVEIIEILVGPGDAVEAEDGLIVLETDKATMEVPSPSAGTIDSISVSVGDKISEGDSFGEITASENAAATDSNEKEDSSAASVPEGANLDASTESQIEASPETSLEARLETIVVPDLGGAEQVEVIELLAKVGETVDAEQSVMVLESDKASMEVPAGKAGTIEKILITLGDKVDQGQAMLEMSISSGASTAPISTATTSTNSTSTDSAKAQTANANTAEESSKIRESSASVGSSQDAVATAGKFVHAGPAVRKIAREFGVDLSLVKGSGPKGRVVKDDVQKYVKESLSSPVAGAAALPKVANVDFAKFGPVESMPLSKIKKATAKNMTASWLNVPMVTQFDQADITELEAFRKETNQKGELQTKLSLIPFIAKALSVAMKEFPQFNASLSADGESLVYKKYTHIGVAVDTPNGLLVPVIRDTDQKNVTEIAQELTDKAHKAREGKLGLSDMQGGCFSISSLGGIGGTAFTPIVNAPEVAILGISKSEVKPIWNGSEFMPKLMVPLSLTYDHRVIDGAEAARFGQRIVSLLQDIRQLLL